jgi:type I restriction-modification system DNA methylase subunit
MNEYSKFVSRLDAHLQAYSEVPLERWKKDSIRLVNGLAAEELRNLVDLEKRREFGAFFTNSDLADKILSNSKIQFGIEPIVYDPAVGAGNLLISVHKQISEKAISFSFWGTDLHQEFIDATTKRLLITDLLAKQKISSVSIKIADGLKDNDFYKQATHIVTNPPFNLIDCDEKVVWGKGKLSAAALFIHSVIRFTKPGTQIIAILPDVLRSGSRYEKWRAMVDENCNIQDITMHGQFDKFADIDVFSLILTKKENPKKTINGHIWTKKNKSKHVIADLFAVSVGNVVDNRDRKDGNLRPFIVSRGLPGWETVSKVPRERLFNGRSVKCPFVVIKRTSRMGDQHRAVATIINIADEVFVDNHLIVLQPKSKKLKDCKLLISKLKSIETDNWINEQIRCRHLTVKIIARLPI